MEIEVDGVNDDLHLVVSDSSKSVRNQWCSEHMSTTLGRFVTKVKENPKLSLGLLATILFISIISIVCLSKPGRGALLNEFPKSPPSKPVHHYLSYFQVHRIYSATKLFPNATVENIGYSVEHRPIEVLKIRPSSGVGTKGGTTSSCSSPLVWVVCGVHAREWASPLTCTYFIKQLAREFKLGREDNLVASFRYNFLVVANPDGFNFTFSQDPNKRTHRKNRRSVGCQTENDGKGDGVDLNRNFPVGFNNNSSVQDDHCSKTYPGPNPFSEPETRAIRDAFQAETPWLSLSVHGNAGFWGYPFAHQPSNPWQPNKQALDSVVKKIKSKFGAHDLRHGCSACVYGNAGGTMTDWVFKGLGVKRSYVVELKTTCPWPNRRLNVQDDICHFQPPVDKALSEIAPRAWYGFRELLKEAYEHDCSRQNYMM